MKIAFSSPDNKVLTQLSFHDVDQIHILSINEYSFLPSKETSQGNVYKLISIGWANLVAMYLDFLFSYSTYLDPLRCVIVATLKKTRFANSSTVMFCKFICYSWQTRFPSLFSVWKLALRLLKFSAEYIKFIIISEKARELIFCNGTYDWLVQITWYV